MADARFRLRGSLDGVAVFDMETGSTVAGPFESPAVAEEEADTLERGALIDELVDQVDADGWNGLAREIRGGLDLNTALSRLATIGQGECEGAKCIEEVCTELAQRGEDRCDGPR